MQQLSTYVGKGLAVGLLALVLTIGAQTGCDDLAPTQAPPSALAARSDIGLVDSCGGLSWAEMSLVAQTRWQVLGWSASSWAGTTAAPASEGKAWRDLTGAQREAALELGCERSGWDAVYEEMEDITEDITPVEG